MAQTALISEIDARALRHWPGHGADPTGQWPPEPSRLIVGLDFDAAHLLADRFGQNGFLWAAADAVPTLVLTC